MRWGPLVLLLTLTSTTATAPPAVRLDFAPSNTCGTARDFTGRLRLRGIEVAQSGALLSIAATMRAAGAEASFTLSTPRGNAERTMAAESCEAVLDAIAFAVELALTAGDDDAPTPALREPEPAPALAEPIEHPFVSVAGTIATGASYAGAQNRFVSKGAARSRSTSGASSHPPSGSAPASTSRPSRTRFAAPRSRRARFGQATTRSHFARAFGSRPAEARRMRRIRSVRPAEAKWGCSRSVRRPR